MEFDFIDVHARPFGTLAAKVIRFHQFLLLLFAITSPAALQC